MGYDVRIFDASFRLDVSKLDEAYERMCALNDYDHIKSGGSRGGNTLTMDDPRPAGMSHHPARWFSWMDADYPSTCANVSDILTMLGFDVVRDSEGSITDLGYDSKIGDEAHFLAVIGDLVDEGSYICWRGEDDEEWRWLFADNTMIVQYNHVTTWS